MEATFLRTGSTPISRRTVRRSCSKTASALDLRYEVMQLGAEPSLTLVAYTAEPGTPSHDNLSLLASWAVTQQRDAELSNSVNARSQ